RVQPGQTIYDIATLYQIPLLALIDQNGLSAPFALHVGQVLRLPPPRFYTIAAGDTLESVARQFNVDARSLALLNRLQSPYGVRVGQTLVLPAIARAAEPEPQSHGDPAPQAAAQTPPPAGDGRFAWPVRGEIAVRFGAQPGGRRSDGVEIEAPEGARFVAAADGEVVYAGADLPAYGALIMIRHADGWVTAYAYGRRALVSEGAHVRRGQPIGEVGAHRGRGLLLFQVRQGRAAVDPLPLLGAP
ncbi:MAG: LysM peptidoglycan-binding domain-containing protein, partial [Hyphomonadaceae bacterium]